MANLNKGFCFGEFEIDADHRLLLKRGEAVPLNSKTFDLLLTLAENHGRVLSKNDLLDKVWENQFVEENNLTVHVAALRKALGETKNEHRFIVTVPGKGYQFVAELDGTTNGDIVVESRRVERIVVEEEIEEQTDGNARALENGHTAYRGLAARSAVQPLGWGIRKRRFAIVIIGIFVLASTGGYVFRERLWAGSASAAPFVQHRVRQLTTNGKVGTAALSPDGKLFAYTIDDLGQKSLSLGYVDGGNHLELRPAAEATYRSLVFSPDNSQLYFSIRDEKNLKFTLYKMPILGGVPTKLVDDVGHFSLSPDGKQLALARRDNEQKKDFIVISAIDGSDRRDVAWFPTDLSFRWDTISWSADGRRLALSAVKDGTYYFDDLAIVDISSGEVSRVPLEDFREITKTAWLKDGSGLIVTAIERSSHSSVPQYRCVHVSLADKATALITTDRSNYGASWHNDAGTTLSLSTETDLLLGVEHRQLSNVWVAPANDLASAHQITFSSFGKYDGLWGMDWTPDGRLIYTTSDTTSQFLSEMNGDGSEQKPITAPGQVDSVLTVSADGRYVLFHSTRNGGLDIWRTDIDGSNPKQLTFGGKGFHPAPSPDGRWVYYKSWLNIGELCRVPMDGGQPECLNNKETSWMSFSPDGKYLAASYITDKQRLAIYSAETNELLKQFDLPKTGTLYMGSRWTPDSKAVTYRDNAYGYWTQTIEGGEPKRLEGLPREKMYNFSWSRDGKWLAYVRGQEIRDVVLIENTSR